MKIKSLLLGALAFAALTFGFSSCDEGENFDSSDIVGTWEQTYLYHRATTLSGEVVQEDTEPMTDGDVTIFNKNGTGDFEGEAFTWTLSGKTLTMNFAAAEKGSAKYTVEKLTSSEAIISLNYNIQKDGVTYKGYNRMTFKRVK